VPSRSVGSKKRFFIHSSELETCDVARAAVRQHTTMFLSGADLFARSTAHVRRGADDPPPKMPSSRAAPRHHEALLVVDAADVSRTRSPWPCRACPRRCFDFVDVRLDQLPVLEIVEIHRTLLRVDADVAQPTDFAFRYLPLLTWCAGPQARDEEVELNPAARASFSISGPVSW